MRKGGQGNSNKRVALVKVLKVEDSGLGYTCYDEEADKKYYHIPSERLEFDDREFTEE